MIAKMRPRLFLLALLCFGALATASAADRYEERATHDPDGIGKFYLGREIAQVMGPGGIAWLERDEREFEEKPALVIDALQVKAGDTVADLGAGSGYYSFRLAYVVGPRGKVLAVDIEGKMLGVIRDRAARQKISNVETIRSTAADPNLAAGSVDLLLMVDVYHELAFPYETMRGVVAALKPGGRVALVEYRKEDPDVPIKAVHKMSERQIIREMKAVGLKHDRTVRSLPLQHLVIFSKESLPQ
jgi:ubiquinone/menaquinone biosynthesis C-methylase UbiE